MEEKNIKIIADQDELEYHLSSIGIDNLFLVIEPDKNLLYFYSDNDDFYYEIDENFINKLNEQESITIIESDSSKYVFDSEQTQIIKDILNGWNGKAE